MKRSILMAVVAALLAVSVSAESVHAQYYQRQHNNNGNIGAALIAGIVAGAIVGTILSQSDRHAMNESYVQVFDRDVEDGYCAPFEGDSHSGYYEVVNQGYHRDYDRCRQIRTVVKDRDGRPVPEYQQRRPRFVCLNPSTNAWVDVDNRYYTVRPVRVVREQVREQRRPDLTVTIRSVDRPNYGPSYGPRPMPMPMPNAGPRPYPGNVRPEYASPRPYPGPAVAGPAGPSVYRPGAPAVLPAMPQSQSMR